MKFKNIIICILVASISLSFSLEYFKGYSSKEKPPVYSTLSLLKTKYNDESNKNENYFHDAYFPDKGITIFTNIIFSKAF